MWSLEDIVNINARAAAKAAKLRRQTRRGPGKQQKPDNSLGVASGSQQIAAREERLARESNMVLPYLRQEDTLCKGFLKLASCQIELRGLSLLFPFVREMALSGSSRTRANLPSWMELAFMAGHDLGVAHPDGLDEVLPGLELREAVRRLGVLRQCSGE